jgi:hypothetical protein
LTQRFNIFFFQHIIPMLYFFSFSPYYFLHIKYFYVLSEVNVTNKIISFCNVNYSKLIFFVLKNQHLN